MLELGPDEHRLHEDVGRYAVEGGADALVTVGSTSDEALDALAEAMAQGGKAVAATRRWCNGRMMPNRPTEWSPGLRPTMRVQWCC